jgi:branched-chain amino acid transport system substrate-binding protein
MKNILLSTLLSVFCVASVSADQDPDFNIGLAVCLSGSCADYGTETIRGAELAAQEINANGGVLGRKIRFSVQDTQEDLPVQSLTAYRKLKTEQSIKYIVGPTWSAAGMTIAPIAKNDDVVVTSPSLGIKDFNETSDNLFNTWPHDEVSARALAVKALDSGKRRAAIFGMIQPWSQLLAKVYRQTFEAGGGTIVAEEEPLPDATDISTETSRILNAKPDIVLICSYTAAQGLQLKKLREMGYRGEIYLVLMDDETVRAANGAAEGVVYTKYPEADSNFQEMYEAAYKKKPGNSADTAYDTVKLYAYAITKAGTFETKSVIQVLNAVTDYRGASGKIQFDGKGGIVREPQFYVVTNGKY